MVLPNGQRPTAEQYVNTTETAHLTKYEHVRKQVRVGVHKYKLDLEGEAEEKKRADPF